MLMISLATKCRLVCISHSYLWLSKLDQEKAIQEENQFIQAVMMEKVLVRSLNSSGDTQTNVEGL